MKQFNEYIFVLLAVLILAVAGCGGSTEAYAPKLDVTAITPGNFTLSGGPPQTVGPGGTATFKISSSAFTSQTQSRSPEPINLTILSGLPAGATGSLSPTTIKPGEDSTLSVQTVNDTAPNDYDIVVQGTQGGVSKTATVRLTVSTEFFLNGGGTQSVQPGQVATYSINPSTTLEVPKSRVGNEVAYQVTSGMPGGATGTFEPTAGSIGNSGTFKITTTDSTPLGSYTVIVTATWGNKTATQSFTLNVVAPDFFLTAPSVVNMGPGVDTDVTVNINPVVAAMSRGFDDVNLRILDPIPTGFTVSLLQSTAKIGGTVTLRIRYDVPAGIIAPKTADPVIGNFTIEGTNGAFTHTTITSAFVTIGGGEDTF